MWNHNQLNDFIKQNDRQYKIKCGKLKQNSSTRSLYMEILLEYKEKYWKILVMNVDGWIFGLLGRSTACTEEWATCTQKYVAQLSGMTGKFALVEILIKMG